MKNNVLIWVAVAVVVLLAILFGLKNNNSSLGDANATTTPNGATDTMTSTPSKTTTKTTPIAGMKVSLGGIFAEKGNYQCDYEQVSQDSRNSSVVYISDGKMRGEFRTSTAQSSKATITVYDGQYLYVWTEGMSKGTRTEPKTIADLPGIIPEDVSSGRILGSSADNVSWNCHAWSKVPSLLTRPSYVSF